MTSLAAIQSQWRRQNETSAVGRGREILRNIQNKLESAADALLPTKELDEDSVLFATCERICRNEGIDRLQIGCTDLHSNISANEVNCLLEALEMNITIVSATIGCCLPQHHLPRILSGLCSLQQLEHVELFIIGGVPSWSLRQLISSCPVLKSLHLRRVHILNKPAFNIFNRNASNNDGSEAPSFSLSRGAESNVCQSIGDLLPCLGIGLSSLHTLQLEDCDIRLTQVRAIVDHLAGYACRKHPENNDGEYECSHMTASHRPPLYRLGLSKNPHLCETSLRLLVCARLRHLDVSFCKLLPLEARAIAESLWKIGYDERQGGRSTKNSGCSITGLNVAGNDKIGPSSLAAIVHAADSRLSFLDVSHCGRSVHTSLQENVWCQIHGPSTMIRRLCVRGYSEDMFDGLGSFLLSQSKLHRLDIRETLEVDVRPRRIGLSPTMFDDLSHALPQATNLRQLDVDWRLLQRGFCESTPDSRPLDEIQAGRSKIEFYLRLNNAGRRILHNPPGDFTGHSVNWWPRIFAFASNDLDVLHWFVINSVGAALR